MSMSGTARASASGLTIAIVLASATFGDHAFAKTKRQPSMPSPAVATATRPMAFSNAEQPPAAAPGRFFTINQVLGKRDGRSDPDTGKLAAATSANTTTDAPGPLVTRRGATSSEPFGLLTFQAPQGLLWVKWRRVEQQIDDEADILRSCNAEPENCASVGAKKFLAIVADAKRWEGRARIEAVNRLVNASIRYES